VKFVLQILSGHFLYFLLSEGLCTWNTGTLYTSTHSTLLHILHFYTLYSKKVIHLYIMQRISRKSFRVGRSRTQMLLLLLVPILLNVVKGYNNGIGRRPPMGWNSWCTGDGILHPSLCNLEGRDPCSETEVKSIADTMMYVLCEILSLFFQLTYNDLQFIWYA